MPFEPNPTKAEKQALVTLARLFTAGYGKKTLQSALALRGLTLKPDELDLLIRKTSTLTSDNPHVVAMALTLPPAIGKRLVEKLSETPAKFPEEEETEPTPPEEHEGISWLTWLSEPPPVEEPEPETE